MPPSDDVVLVDPEIADLVPGFLTNRRAEAQAMRRALERSDLTGLTRLGHDLRGCAPSYGFHELGLLGGEVEAAAQRGDAAELEDYVSAIEDYLAAVRWAPDPELEDEHCMDW